MALQTLIRLLSFMALFLMLANKAHSQEDVTSFAFDSFVPDPEDLTYQGDARVLSDSKVLTLAGTDSSGNKKKSTVGRVLYSKPIKFWESASSRQATFETTIRFVNTPSKNGGYDGLAFFIAPVNTTIPSGAITGNLGIFNPSTGTTPSLFAVEFDTLSNNWDPRYQHIGIDITSRTSRNVTKFESATGQVVTARINYNPNTRTISVVASTSDSQTAELSYVFDLKSLLHEEVQVGISAASSYYISSVGVFDLLSWYFTSSLVYDSANEETYTRQYVSV